MNIFGLDPGQVRELVWRVSPHGSPGTSPVAADTARVAAGASAAGAGEAASGVAGAGGAVGEEAAGVTDVADRFARAAWSTIAEPGDGDAGLLVNSLGAAGALAAVIEKWPQERIVEAVREVDPAASDAFAGAAPDALRRWLPRLLSVTVVRALEQAARVQARLLTPADPYWPSGLADLGPHAPIALWCRGQLDACTATERSISLVGARASTGYGEHVAMEAAAGLVDRGFAIVSGAAYGIDGMAHRAALASRGVTIAVLAGGVDRFYPSGHDALLGRIVESGAVLSELPCGAAPTRWRFLQRNRLIAAASQATIVLEAGWRSGSLNTAGHAAALGRPLGAVPGPVTSPTSAGCHRLIRDYGAICVTNAAEMAELAGDPGGNGEVLDPTRDSGEERRSADETRVRDALSQRSARSVADIANRAGMTVSAVEAVLGTLALDGAVREREKGWVVVAGR
ncbi:MAG: processing protein [Microbacteriaceae bacterium]|jgi:DNA processing protein|nr:processing protein [Microbacteriaceae bacterium]